MNIDQARMDYETVTKHLRSEGWTDAELREFEQSIGDAMKSGDEERAVAAANLLASLVDEYQAVYRMQLAAKQVIESAARNKQEAA